MTDLVKVHDIVIEYMSLDNLITSSFTLSEFVDWLLCSHVHFIISYTHEGLENFGWNITDIYAELQRLKYHSGFPSGSQLQCPIFTQDKMKYLEALAHVSMRTLMVPISADMDMLATSNIMKRCVCYAFCILLFNMLWYHVLLDNNVLDYRI